VKIWGSPLRCPVCQQDVFHFRKVAITDQEKPGGQELGYLFECARCGYSSLFSGGNVAENETLTARSNVPARHRV